MLGFREAASLPAVKWREKNLGGLNKRKHEPSCRHDWKMCSFKTDDCEVKAEHIGVFHRADNLPHRREIAWRSGWQYENENRSPRDRNDWNRSRGSALPKRPRHRFRLPDTSAECYRSRCALFIWGMSVWTLRQGLTQKIGGNFRLGYRPGVRAWRMGSGGAKRDRHREDQ